MRPTRAWITPAIVVPALLSVVLVVTGCGSGSTDKSDSTSTSTSTASASTTTSSGGDTSGAVVPGVPTLAELAKGFETVPPATSPPGAKGKTVWWVECGAAAAACSVPAQAAQQAAKTLGINLKVIDGKLNVEGGYLNAIRTALAAKADAIVLYGMGCPQVIPGLKEAKKQGVPVLGVETPDCDLPPSTTGQKLLTADLNYSPSIPSTEAFFKQWGKTGADYIINLTNGKAKLIYNQGTDSVFPLVDEGFREEFAKCKTCEIVDTITYVAADQVPNGPWTQKFRASLVKHPEANSTFTAPDFHMVALGGLQAVKQTNPKMIVVAGAGSAAGLDAVRNGQIAADPGVTDPEWTGYAGVDAVNRLLNGAPQVTEGVGQVTVTKDHNLPPKGGEFYESPVPWKAAYEKAWAAAK